MTEPKVRHTASKKYIKNQIFMQTIVIDLVNNGQTSPYYQNFKAILQPNLQPYYLEYCIELAEVKKKYYKKALKHGFEVANRCISYLSYNREDFKDPLPITHDHELKWNASGYIWNDEEPKKSKSKPLAITYDNNCEKLKLIPEANLKVDDAVEVRQV